MAERYVLNRCKDLWTGKTIKYTIEIWDEEKKEIVGRVAEFKNYDIANAECERLNKI